MAGYSEFSFTALWARIGGAADKAVAATGNAPRGVIVDLPETERAALSARIAPFVTGLEDLRRDTLSTVDRRARLMVPLAGGSAFVALLVAGQGMAAALIFGSLAAVVGWFLAMGNRSTTYQSTVKSRLGSIISDQLSGFDHIVAPETDLARLRDWHLFPALQSAQTLDRIKGQRDGRPLSLSEMVIAYAPGRRSKLDHSLSFSVVEVASDAVEGALVVLTPKDAPSPVLETQRQSSDLQEAMTGHADFDAAYSLRLSRPDAAGGLGAELRDAILSLGKTGPNGRPYLVFLPGYLAVLFPTGFQDHVFHVPPYWVPLDPEGLLAQFASDLALKNALINAVLALPTRPGLA